MINIDTVYQKVLAITNKEQRGYITPHEFNLFADQAQMEIFEQYFYDINQFDRVPNNSTGYSNIVDNLREKIQLFQRYNREVQTINEWGDINITDSIPDLYRLGTVKVKYTDTLQKLAEQVQLHELDLYSTASSLTARNTTSYPIYTRILASNEKSYIKIYPYPNTDLSGEKVVVSYIRKPNKPSWGYIVVNDKPLYNSQTSINFELHPSEESELVYKILMLFGINLKEPQLGQAAAAIEANKVQQEKQ
tara:strand:- start:9384 stop:10130 length:747 start_codon:yes stop_codon:yes gene_type:complete